MSRANLAGLAGLVALALAAGCGGHDHDHAGGGHDHGHDDGDDARPSVVFTRWSAVHELFVEHPALVVGQPSPMAAHVTRLAGHDPLTEGPLTVELRQADGTTVTVTADAPVRAGIYTPAPVPTAPGPCTLVFRAAGDELAVDACVVHAAGAALPDEDEEPAGRISFLKEQSWLTDLATEPVDAHPLTPTLRATGELRAMAGREARITATAHGRLELAKTPPVLGMTVTAGQVLATIAPALDDATPRVALDADARAARAELAAAEAQLARSQRLLDAGAIPARQLEEARTRVELARARLAATSGRLGAYDASASGKGGAGRFAVRAPIAGTLVAIDATAGQTVEHGAPLFTVVDLDRVWLHVDVFEPDLARIARATTATFRVDGYDELFAIAPPDGRVVTIGQLVDERTRTVPVIFELTNPERKLRIGSFATVFIATGAPYEALAIPDAAIVQDAGRPVAYVQVGGESFERRVLELGARSAGRVEVKSGLAAGERVVVRGAYDVKLAASGGAVPEHGHAH